MSCAGIRSEPDRLLVDHVSDRLGPGQGSCRLQQRVTKSEFLVLAGFTSNVKTVLVGILANRQFKGWLFQRIGTPMLGDAVGAGRYWRCLSRAIMLDREHVDRPFGTCLQQLWHPQLPLHGQARFPRP